MSPVQIFACLVLAASGLNINRGESHAEAVDDEASCKMVTTAVPGGLALVSDDTLDDEDTMKQEEVAMEVKNDVTEAEEKWKHALKEYRQKKKAYKVASGDVMKAIDTLLEVPTADVKELEAIAKGGDSCKKTTGEMCKDHLVVFYAPWCPHCQVFVLHDTFGNPLGAPLEALRRDLSANEKTTNVEIVRADITTVGKDIPKEFVVMGIPTVYFVSGDGEATQYSGNPHDNLQLTDFVQGAVAVAVKKAAKETKEAAKETKEVATEVKEAATKTKKASTETKEDDTEAKKDDTEAKEVATKTETKTTEKADAKEADDKKADDKEADAEKADDKEVDKEVDTEAKEVDAEETDSQKKTDSEVKEAVTKTKEIAAKENEKAVAIEADAKTADAEEPAAASKETDKESKQ